MSNVSHIWGETEEGYAARVQAHGKTHSCEVSPLASSPKPWCVHRTGSHIGIKDAEGKFVIRKVVSAVSMEEYQQLSINFEHIVLCVNSISCVVGGNLVYAL